MKFSTAIEIFLSASVVLSASSGGFASAFVPSHHGHNTFFVPAPKLSVPSTTLQSFSPKQDKASTTLLKLAKSNDDDDDEDETPVNPYADPNYPDLEFVNYDDPEYSVDQGTDEFFDADSTEEEIEEMREERRVKNDEFQFETYHAEVLKSGDEYKGEWTVFRTNTFLEGADPEVVWDSPPEFRRERVNRKVVTVGKKAFLPEPEGGFETRLDGERLVHEERVATKDDFEEVESGEDEIAPVQTDEYGNSLVGRRFWPEQTSSFDFRGEAGIMCVGNGYTICDAEPLLRDGDVPSTEKPHDGPFTELKTEVGIQYKRMRFRVKFHYCIKDFGPNGKMDVSQVEDEYPALHLVSMVVCRETRGRWPRYENQRNVDESDSERLFGTPGAQGGLYDPPPVGSDEQASQYMLLDLEGHASVLFPYKIDQDPNAFDGNGWVTSLDWCPGRLRLQLDRKVNGGKDIKGLKTLELSEVEADTADQWRPKDGGEDMRQ